MTLSTYDRAALDFEGEVSDIADRVRLRRCPMNHHNAEVVRDLFEFARPVLIGTDNSFGFGDRLGVANPAHLLAHVDYGGPVTAVIGRDTMVGAQFHPEKSQKAGLRMIANFLTWRP